MSPICADRLIAIIPVRLGASAMVLNERSRLYVADLVGPYGYSEANHVTVVDAVRLKAIGGFQPPDPFQALAEKAGAARR